MSKVILPSPLTWAKSLTLRSSALAIRGVPRLRPAISSDADFEMDISKILDERLTMLERVSTL